MRKALALALFALCAAPMFASVQLDTSINDVFNRGSNELAGSITWNVTGDDFREASTEEPIFIRVTPDHNAFLAETLVHQTGNVALLQDPILLAMRLDGGNGLVSMAALEEAVSIVRWVEGESSLWIQVQQSSDQWLQAPGGLVGPSVDLEVSWTIGISARLSDLRNDENAAQNDSNLPFNTRDAAADEGEVELATSTLICVDLRQSNLLADGSDESLLKYDIIAYDYRAEIGTGVYSGQAGRDTGINFTNDFSIARGKSRACTVTAILPKDAEQVALLCIYRAQTNGTTDEFVKLTNTLTLRLDCEFGGNYLDTDLVAGSYVAFRTGSRGQYGFDEVSNARFTNVTGYTTVGSSFNNHGRTLWRNVNLYYNGAPVSLNHPYDLDIEVCVYQHYTDAPIEALLDWYVVLLSHDGARDEEPYDGNDQYRRCEPSTMQLNGGVYSVGYYVACTGNPVSIFFPYLPRLQGNVDFWVGLSTVNQGGVELDVEAIGYDEDGNRYTGDLGSLDVHNQKTWLLIENANGVVTVNGAGGNNSGEVVSMDADDPNLPADEYGKTRSSLFVRGTFPAQFLDDVFSGDLDGYLLIGNQSTSSVDGAYLPRNYDNDIPGQNADLPLWRSKNGGAKASKVRTEIETSSPVK